MEKKLKTKEFYPVDALSQGYVGKIIAHPFETNKRMTIAGVTIEFDNPETENFFLIRLHGIDGTSVLIDLANGVEVIE